MKFKIILYYFILCSLLVNYVFSNENNKPEQQQIEEDNNLLMKNLEDNINNQDYLNKINFEDKIRSTVDKIMNTANNDNELSRLFGYLFGYNLNEQNELLKEKQSKMEQLKDYFETFNEIIGAHRYSIDYGKVQKLVHEIATSSSKVYKLNDKETAQLERDLYRLTNYLLKRVLNSFGIQEENKKDKSENVINDHLFVEGAANAEKKEVDDIANSINKDIQVINSISEIHIKQLAHHIVLLANNNPNYAGSDSILNLLDVEKKSLDEQENSVSSFIKVTLGFVRSLLVFLATLNEEVNEGDILQHTTKSNKAPEWLSDSTIKDIQSLTTKEFLNPRTIIAFNKLFVRDSRPLEMYEKESLTHQLIDLAYSVLYGKNSDNEINTNDGIATVNKQQDKFVQTSVNQELIDRIIKLAYETDEKSKESNIEGLFYRSIRLFFSLFHIDDYYYENQQDQDDNIQENELKSNIELVPEEYNDKQEKNINNEDYEDDEDEDEIVNGIDEFKDYQDNDGASKIQYIAQRVNKLIDSDLEAKDDDIKRAENVFRILYKLYLHYYGYQDDNQLEQPKSNKVVEDLNSEKAKRDNDELLFIQEVIPTLTEQDISNVLLELDRAANQLGYKSRSIDDEIQDENYNELEKKERDLSHFQYQ